MTGDILTILETEAHGFSKGQRKIAAFITESYDKAAFMTASKLGKVVGVSESTVVRFAVDLGYDGYPSMQKALQEMVLNRLTPVQRIEIANDRFSDQDLLATVLHGDMEKLRQTEEMIDKDAFNAAVNALLKAKKIYIIGVRSASALVNFAGYYLNYMFDSVHLVTGSGGSETFERLVSVQAGDAVLAFSFPRYSTSTTRGIRYCRSKGATVISITNSMMSPIAENSDYVLLAKSDMVSLVDTLVAPMSVVNALMVSLASKRENVLSKNFKMLESVWEEYNVYEKRTEKI